MTPQLLPAIVSTALAMGSRLLSQQGVLVKRLMSIEDLGDIDILLTDKTGTLTTGSVDYEASYSVGLDDPISFALLATDTDYATAAKSTEGMAPLDAALWKSESTRFPAGAQKIASLPFDHIRRRTSVLVDVNGERKLVIKGSPEDVITLCLPISLATQSLLQSLYDKGERVIAVATKSAPGLSHIDEAHEKELLLLGFLTFSDPVKDDARESLEHLRDLGIEVKVATGDSLDVARTICEKVGLEIKGALSGKDIEDVDDADLPALVKKTTLFARVSPEQKARILLALRADETSVAFLGDGVNDAIALHDADVGISVNSATDVAYASSFARFAL